MRKLIVLAPLLGSLLACVIGDGEDGPAGAETSASAGSGANAASGGNSSSGGSSASGGDATTGGGAANGTGSGAGGGPSDPCPADMVCVSTFPFSHAATTTGAASDQFDSYGCGTQDESGPEVIYRIDVPSAGFLIADLPQSGMAPGADIDLHLLDSLDPNDCRDRGHWQLGELLPAGRYYLVADTWVADDGSEADGDYALEVGLITEAVLQAWGMSPAVASDALFAFDTAWTAGDVETDAYAVVDFALHASERRMWVFDVFEASLRHHTYTTVGDMSDPNGDGWADVFSNTSGSHQSSLGMMKASEAYTGMYGKSVRLDGLEPGYNDRVRSRAIVIHPWSGSTQAYVDAYPATGAAPTWGCLGIDNAIAEDVRDYLSGGGLVLSHFPDGDWSAQSSYLP